MEMANDAWRVRPARHKDKGRIATLLRRAERCHLHVDWRLPVDWLEQGVFVVAEKTPPAARPAGDGPPPAGDLIACLAVGADPPPAAWVRVLALAGGLQIPPLFSALFDAALPPLRRSGIGQLGWLPQRSWPRPLLHNVGFHLINEVETFLKDDLQLPDHARGEPAAVVRPARPADLPHLAAIEAAAFDPLWRHSAEALELALGQSITFDVAELDGRVVGFQYSVAGDEQETAHLVRLTVSPDVQRRGIGSSLLAAAIDAYRRGGFCRISLNTQADNVASKRLYQKFGFRAAGFHLPVWSMDL